MTEDLTQIWREYRADCIKSGDMVIDIGSSEGYFTDWARSRGATVEAYDARYGCAVGSIMGRCRVEGQGLGAYIVPGDGDVLMVSLDSVLNYFDRVDFLKVDIEGGEYSGMFRTPKMDRVQRFAIEFHCWTTPDCPVEGLGVKNGQMPPNAFRDLYDTLTLTHDVEVVGDPAAGGYLFGTLHTSL